MTTYSQITNVYEGGDKIFPIPYDFIDKNFITVSVNGEEITGYEIDNFSVIIYSALKNGDLILITRHTDAQNLLVKYTGRNDLNSTSLNLSNTQLFHLVQETLDLISHALILNYLGQWDCRGLTLSNVAQGTKETDAPNIRQTRQIAKNEVHTHELRNDNPHEVNKTQIGLGNCDNTSDFDKPLSKASLLALNTKVAKIEGKGLSQEDFTTIEKQKLNSVEHGAQVNVQSDWANTDPESDSYIKNKIIKLSELVNDTNFISSNTLKNTDNLQEGQVNKYDKKVFLNAGANIIVSGSYPNFTISSTGSTTKTNWGGIEGDILNQADLVKFIQNNGGGLMFNELVWNYPDSNIDWSK